MPPQLVALTEGPDLLLDKPILLLGRHQECDIQLNSRKISRRHCCIAQVNDQLVVRDLCSTNGIRINGVRVVEGYLKPGDQLTIGNFNYKLSWDMRPEATGGHHAEPPPPRLAEPIGNVFESCEMPIPLAEPGDSSGPRPRPPSKSGEKKPVPPDAPPSLILPEHLELAPISDMFPKNNPPPSPSNG